MERPDLYEDDLTEERYPSPARRDEVAATETLDPDTNDGNGEPLTRAPRAADVDPDDDDVEDDEEEDDDDIDDDDDDVED